jgi:hypothetical protein
MRALILVLAVVIAGCDLSAAPRDEQKRISSASPVRDPGGRHQVDASRNRVWFLTKEGVFLYDASRPARVAFDLPGLLWAGEPYGCLPDLALGPKGEAVVTSDITSTLWRIDPVTLAVSVHPLTLDADRDKDVGFSALVYSAQQGVFFAASYHHGTLWRIDPQLRSAQKIALTAPISRACGLALQPRSSPQALSRVADLCVRASGRAWSVLFAPDWRSAYVSAAACRSEAAG